MQAQGAVSVAIQRTAQLFNIGAKRQILVVECIERPEDF